ncbi:hypothetical protein DOTSEDRAFT_74614 [Dothistroma septosporum NZE10]|uniref:Uncharacterized protein n=1 Tax=Dothistroma septosporum (strain NZE10 / CBS 128990) TaxID=675120 RepID=N1PBU0_DOTSN|nr:hypothetical protein DOTSEDRAFT_74614 [Dothistroma septosporum NZE10]
MTSTDPSMTENRTEVVQSAVDGLEGELNASSPLDAVLDSAIRDDNKDLVRAIVGAMEGSSTLASKRLAIIFGKPELLRILLEMDREIDDSIVETALECKDYESLNTLLDFGWRIETRIGLDLSPLDFAVDDLALMQCLVRLGANVNARSRLDESSLSRAIVSGSMEVVRYLIDEGTDLRHGNLLHCAAERSDQFEGADLVEELVKKGASVNAYRFHNPIAFRWRGLYTLPTALHIASANGNVLVAEALFRHGADPHQPMLQATKLTKPSSLDIAHQNNNAVLVDLFTGRLAPRCEKEA